LTIAGKENLHTVKLPNLNCQPGINGWFTTKQVGVDEASDAKIFEIQITPLSPWIKAFPAIEFSFFDPKQKSYGVSLTKPIPLKVAALTQTAVFEPKEPVLQPAPEVHLMPFPFHLNLSHPKNFAWRLIGGGLLVLFLGLLGVQHYRALAKRLKRI
jgi:hypothetical protein